MILEDDRHIGLALQIRLRASGYDVELASSVCEAQEQIQQSIPDAAVLDYNLPDGNGIDFMKTLRACDLGRNIIIVIMTASRQVGLRDRALESGASFVLEKPFDSATLLNCLRAASPIEFPDQSDVTQPLCNSASNTRRSSGSS